MRTALIVGSTGLVGAHVLRQVLNCAEYSRVTALVRRPLEFTHEKLDARVIDFDRLGEEDLPAVDDVYCALGTTIRKAKSKEDFRRIDFGYPSALAEQTALRGAKRFLLVTSVATDSGSPNFYLRVKGDLEGAVAGLPFEQVDYFRPSFLMGDRSDRRFLEWLGIAFAQTFRFLLFGPMRIYRPIAAEQVARAMVGRALRGEPGRHIHHYDDMLAVD